MVFGLPDLAWSSRFFQLKWNSFNHHLVYCTVIRSFHIRNVSGYFRVVIAQFELIKCKFPRIEQHCTFVCAAFKSHEMKLYTIYQHTNYYDTANCSGYIPQFDLFQSHNIWAAKFLTHPRINDNSSSQK